ncbi:MAG: DUF427 domain-containing protein [Rhodobacteraceae bacterium]|nr:DUF427 domain-containing protein [Paracoccaceae bacterium]
MSEPRITIQSAEGKWMVRTSDSILGETNNAVVLREADFAPVVYFPRADISMELLERSTLKIACPYKGEASYFSIFDKNGVLLDAVWSYETPMSGIESITRMLAFAVNKTVVEQM